MSRWAASNRPSITARKSSLSLHVAGVDGFPRRRLEICNSAVASGT